MSAELRRALESLVRRRTFSTTVVLTLALAFSIPGVVLSTLDRHFWRPLDLVDSHRLFTLQIRNQDGRFSPLSHPEYLRLRDEGAEAAFSLATFGQLDFTLVAGETPDAGKRRPGVRQLLHGAGNAVDARPSADGTGRRLG